MSQEHIDLKQFIGEIPDWPKEGILFRDITPLLADPTALTQAIRRLVAPFKDAGVEQVIGVEARGFIFGSAVAETLNAGFVPIRKPGKLPKATESITYDLEYGQDTLEIHADAFKAGTKVLMVDDLLATGGTMSAACKLVERAGGNILGISFLVELLELAGRDKLANYNINSIIQF